MPRQKVRPISAPIPPGAVLLRRGPAGAVSPGAPGPHPRPFRITVEGMVFPNGQPGIARVDIAGDPRHPLTALEAEAILHRIACVPPTASLQAPPEAPDGPEADPEDGGPA